VNPRRLYRSRTDRQLAGVAGGIARYLDVDPTVVRILWILSIFFGGFGILLYIIMAFIVPLEPVAGPPPGWAPGGPAGWTPGSPSGAPAGEASTAADGEAGSPPADTSAAWASTPSWEQPAAGWQPPAESQPGRGALVVGVLLVAFGSIALAGVLLPGWAIGAALGPAFLVALGIALLVGALRRPAPDAATES
jgi:phage shock protein PspC (stress-responsive transcriptional regulator)